MTLFLAVAAATLASEDLACIAAGLLVARGEMPLVESIAACFVGILVGDLLLYAAGRFIGRAALERLPLRKLASPDRVRRASQWLERRGPIVILATRLVPGTRLPTYVAAGALRTSFPAFLGWFSLAAALWTPLLVGGTAVAGTEGLARFEDLRRSATGSLLLGGGALLVGLRVASSLATHRGRRLWVSSWQRATRWEFWPPWLFYSPVVAYVLWLAAKHRCLTLFTAANPAMPAGGFVDESKSDILRALLRGGAPVARFELVSATLDPAGRLAVALAFLHRENLPFPIVVKPDVGERGRGVSVVRDRAGLAARLAEMPGDAIVQEHVPGVEFGVFYARLPGEARGRIFSITQKRFPQVVADGSRSVERLILDDPRGVCMARFHLERLADRLDEVPPRGEAIPLAEIGNHCKGALFLDGGEHATAALARAVDDASRGVPGFYFGRFDVRAPSVEAFRAGCFTILELNGVSSESTDIYDPRNGLFAAWRKLRAQWRLAYDIGERNRSRGFAVTPFRTLAGLLLRRALRRGRPAPIAPASGQASSFATESTQART